jgi:hypothetical protein
MQTYSEVTILARVVTAAKKAFLHYKNGAGIADRLFIKNLKRSQ